MSTDDDATPVTERTTMDWVREHRYVVALLVFFTIAGMVTAPLLFPSISLFRALLGGALFGIFCTFCVALPRFFE